MRRGEQALGVELGDETRDEIAATSGGDARNALNILEAAVASAAGEPVTKENVQDAARKRPLRADKGGAHHDGRPAAWRGRAYPQA